MCATCDEKVVEGSVRNWYGVDLDAWVYAAVRHDRSATFTKILVPVGDGRTVAVSLEPLYRALSGNR